MDDDQVAVQRRDHHLAHVGRQAHAHQTVREEHLPIQFFRYFRKAIAQKFWEILVFILAWISTFGQLD